jgi:SAM-dependent methyltransferase
MLHFGYKNQIQGRQENMKKILDVGAGNGDFLAMLEDKIIKKSAVEPLKFGAEEIKRKVPGARVWNLDLAHADLPKDEFDAVTAWHVLEHLEDPLAGAKKIYDSLEEGGYFHCQVPNIESLGFKIAKENWYYVDAPRHLSHFSPSTLKRLLENAGFKNIEITYYLFNNPLDVFRSLQNLLHGSWIAYSTLPFSFLIKLYGHLVAKSEVIGAVAQK